MVPQGLVDEVLDTPLYFEDVASSRGRPDGIRGFVPEAPLERRHLVDGLAGMDSVHVEQELVLLRELHHIVGMIYTEGEPHYAYLGR